MIKPLMHRPYHVTSGASAYGAFATLHHGHFDHCITASTSDEKVGLLLDGWLFGGETETLANDSPNPNDNIIHECLRRYLLHGIKFVKDLNGQFNLLVWDDRSRSVYLVNDRYGLRPLQYALCGTDLYFAPEAKAILASSPVSKRINPRMVINQLSWGRIWIGEETLFENILMLPPASILHWRDGSCEIKRYWDYVYKPEATIDDEFVEHAVATFEQAVARQTMARLRYGVSLSGGLDSRTVLYALSRQNPEIKAFTWGVSDQNDEVALARSVAGQLNVPWHYIHLTPQDYILHARDGAYLAEGLDLHVQSFGLSAFPSIQKQVDVLLTGLALDLTLGGSYLPPVTMLSGHSSAELDCNWALKKAQLFSPKDCVELLQIKGSDEIIDGLRERAVRIWDGIAAEPGDQCDRFFLRTRVWRYTFLRQMWQRIFVEDIAPTFDNSFVDCMLKIPSSWRAEHRFYQRFLGRLAPSMMNIPNLGSMLPPSAPIDCWKLGSQLEQDRECLYRDIWRATEGKVFIPYQRFATNYDEWLRRDRDWWQITDDLLLGKQSLSCDQLLNREKVVQLIEEHRAGAANHRQILQIMTLELFLRVFFA